MTPTTPRPPEPGAGRRHEPSSEEALALLAEFVVMLRRSGQEILLAGGALALVVAGLLAQSGAVHDLHRPLAGARLLVLAALAAGALRCAALLALTHGSVLHPLSVIRRATDAPARSGWRPYLRVPPRAPSGRAMYEHVQLLIAEAHDRHYHAHAALRWAFACAGTLVLWTVLNTMAGAG
ncbi:hypothetical protein SMC26_25135 [Actinomadura fulvescens]|uniref:Uncharacterized protein n=1 Tax=Actinomadura fulvescens TaxID=46160 RepID=A0ABN3Q490_9ACTN